MTLKQVYAHFQTWVVMLESVSFLSDFKGYKRET